MPAGLLPALTRQRPKPALLPPPDLFSASQREAVTGSPQAHCGPSTVPWVRALCGSVSGLRECHRGCMLEGAGGGERTGPSGKAMQDTRQTRTAGTVPTCPRLEHKGESPGQEPALGARELPSFPSGEGASCLSVPRKG